MHLFYFSVCIIYLFNLKSQWLQHSNIYVVCIIVTRLDLSSSQGIASMVIALLKDVYSFLFCYTAIQSTRNTRVSSFQYVVLPVAVLDQIEERSFASFHRLP
jgi:hypothetical protein